MIEQIADAWLLFVITKVACLRLLGKATSAKEKQTGSLGENDLRLSHGIVHGWGGEGLVIISFLGKTKTQQNNREG